MLIARLKGGLGNQLFMYAFGLYLKKELEEKILFDGTTYFKIFYNEYNQFSRKYNISLSINRLIDLKIYNSFILKILHRIAKQNTKIFKLKWLPYIINEELSMDDCKSYNIKFLDGYYIRKDFALAVINDVKLKNINLNPRTKNLYNKISKTNSIAIHVRGKQYINDDKIKITYAPIGSNYYYNAISVIANRIKKPKFFVFSNDIKYAKEVLNFVKKDILYVEDTKDYEDLFLMSKCKNNIIVNSTFSWWAAFLNENKYKLVICPKKWSGEFVVNKYYDSLPLDNWIKKENI